jgi:predicted nucleotidyltransferase
MGYIKNASRTSLGDSRTTVADALFTATRQRVLAVLFGNPGRSFYANEIIRLAAAGTGAVQRELTSLASADLLTVKAVGNQKHFQANASAPVFASLRDIVLKTSGLADVLRAALAAFGTEISTAFVFGSVAKHEDRSGSDIDLMVISDTLAYGELFSGLEASAKRLGRTINPTLYSRQEFDKRMRAKQTFIVRVLAQPKIWIVGSEHDLAS